MKKIGLLFAVALLPFFAQAQKLEGIKDVLKSGGSGGEGRSGGGRGGDNYSIWGDLLLNLALEPTWWLLYGFPGEMPANEASFNDYPYAEGRHGQYLPFDDYLADKRMSLQLTAHLQTDQDAVHGGFVQARWSPNRALNLEASHLQLLETLDDGRGGSAGTDQFAITNFSLTYNRVRHPNFQLWWGAGLMLLNGGGNELLYGSPTANLGFTWYVKRPISLYADAQVGYPNGVYARQHQVRAQVHLKQFMLYAGYQGTKVGDVNLPNVALGTGVWF